MATSATASRRRTTPWQRSVEMLHSSTVQALRFVLLMSAVAVIFGSELSIRQNLLLMAPSLLLNVLAFATSGAQSSDRQWAGTIEAGTIYLTLILVLLVF